jgi:TolB-like protein
VKKKIPLFLLLAALFPCAVVYAGMLPEHAFSDDARGTTSASFLKSPASARLSALGSGAAALKAPDSFFFNPGGAAYLPEGESALLLGYESLLEGAGRTAVAGLRGLERGALGLGALYRYETGLKKYDDRGNAAGGFEAYDAAFAASYGARFGWGDAGLALKYIRSRLYDRSADSVALDLGVVIKDRRRSNAEFAFFARNFGTPMKLGSEKAPLPLELGAGLSWPYTPRFTAFIDGRMPADHSPYLILAGEYSIPFAGSSGLFLRAGFNFKNQADLGLMAAFSSGFGVKLGDALFDYAFVPFGDIGVTHRFTLGWGFGASTGARGSGPGAPSVEPGARERGEKISVTVATFESGAGATEGQARQISDLLESELLKTGAFKLVERTKMDFILAEKKLVYSGLAEKERSVELARLVGAKAALFGSVSRNDKGYIISVKLVDTGTGELLVVDNRSEVEDYRFKQAARELASVLASR